MRCYDDLYGDELADFIDYMAFVFGFDFYTASTHELEVAFASWKLSLLNEFQAHTNPPEASSFISSQVENGKA